MISESSVAVFGSLMLVSLMSIVMVIATLALVYFSIREIVDRKKVKLSQKLLDSDYEIITTHRGIPFLFQSKKDKLVVNVWHGKKL